MHSMSNSFYEQKSLSERDICTKYVVPALQTSGWDMVNRQLGEIVLDPACGTGIKTNLLFFTKGQSTKEIWYYEHPYPPGAKSYNKTKPIRIEEFDAEKAWWFGEQPKKKGNAKVAAAPHDASFFTNRVESPQAWRVTIEQIQANGYNLDIKKTHDTSEAHADPGELLADYQILNAELQQTRDRLKDELFLALNNSREGTEARR